MANETPLYRIRGWAERYENAESRQAANNTLIDAR